MSVAAGLVAWLALPGVSALAAPLLPLPLPLPIPSEEGDREAGLRVEVVAPPRATPPGGRGDRQTAPPRSAPGGSQREPLRPAPGVRPLSAEDEKRLEAARERRRREAAAGEPDVLLDIPNVSIDEVTVEINDVKAHLSLDARVANLVVIKAGVDAEIGRLFVTVRGVRAEALLKVRLQNVADILDRALTTVDRNPQIVDRLLQTVDSTVSTVGRVAETALQPGGLLSQTVNVLGQTVVKVVDTTGNILERTLDTVGGVLNERMIGKVLDLPLLAETTNALGQTVRRVVDPSGAVIEVTLDDAGGVVGARVLSTAAPAAPAGNGDRNLLTPLDDRGPFTGLIVDARGLGVQPAPNPTLSDPKGEVVYDASRADTASREELGVVGYADTIAAAMQMPRAGKHPLIVRATGSPDQTRRNITVSATDAQRIRDADRAAGFLKKAAVVFVVDPPAPAR